MVVDVVVVQFDLSVSLLENSSREDSAGMRFQDDWTELVSLRAERDRLATDLGIRSEILEEVANGTTPATRTSIQARHEQLWAEIAKK